MDDKQEGVAITPTIGRIVWYTPTKHETPLQPDNSQPLAATICYVHSEKLVNLAVYDQNGKSWPKTSIHVFQGDAEDCPPGHCCWMPYQKQQAAKAEAEETAAA